MTRNDMVEQLEKDWQFKRHSRSAETGWTIDYGIISAIAKKIGSVDYAPSEASIELVLLALEGSSGHSDLIEAKDKELAELREQLAAFKKDALRYRKARDGLRYLLSPNKVIPFKEVDAIYDAAMQAEPSPSGD